MEQGKIETRWLTGENATFSRREGLLYLICDGEEHRVRVVRAFPFESLWEYVSLLDDRNVELGMIRTLSDVDEESAVLLREELERRYYVLQIRRIRSLKERHGFSYWSVETTDGEEISFTVHDTYRNLLRVGEDRVFVLDVDGNRFEIPSLQALDRKSLRRIELYV